MGVHQSLEVVVEVVVAAVVASPGMAFSVMDTTPLVEVVVLDLDRPITQLICECCLVIDSY